MNVFGAMERMATPISGQTQQKSPLKLQMASAVYTRTHLFYLELKKRGNPFNGIQIPKGYSSPGIARYTIFACTMKLDNFSTKPSIYSRFQ